MLAFGVIAAMLWVVEFPIFVIFFFGIFGYFLSKIFAAGSRNETREIFEFYLSAHEILKRDGRRWFGFEIRDVTVKGEQIVQRMTTPPPLVHFALGALHNRMGEHNVAVKYFDLAVAGGSEEAVVAPSDELRNYVRVLRKIEREPAEAPLTSAAVFELEQLRNEHFQEMLAESREQSDENAIAAAVREAPLLAETVYEHNITPPPGFGIDDLGNSSAFSHETGQSGEQKGPHSDPFAQRKPITEVLHDIYDKNVQ